MVLSPVDVTPDVVVGESMVVTPGVLDGKSVVVLVDVEQPCRLKHYFRLDYV